MGLLPRYTHKDFGCMYACVALWVECLCEGNEKTDTICLETVDVCLHPRLGTEPTQQIKLSNWIRKLLGGVYINECTSN